MRYAKNKYRSTASRRKAGRILFLSAVGAALVLSFLMLGNLLHDRLEKAAPLLNLPAITYADSDAHETPAVPYVPTPFRSGESVDGIFCTVDASVFSSEDSSSLKEACSVAAELYDGLSVTVADTQGLRFSLDDTPESGMRWKEVTDAAGICGLTVSAVWILPDAVPDSGSASFSSILALAKAGADEILFTGLSSASLSRKEVEAMTALCLAVREIRSDVRIGFALSPQVFADVDSAPLLEVLASHTDLLAADLGEPPADDPDGAEYALSAAEKLYGSIRYYPLRLLVRGSPARLAAQCAALQEAGYGAVQSLS